VPLKLYLVSYWVKVNLMRLRMNMSTIVEPVRSFILTVRSSTFDEEYERWCSCSLSALLVWETRMKGTSLLQQQMLDCSLHALRLDTDDGFVRGFTCKVWITSPSSKVVKHWKPFNK
jgi:hypothetical protein